MSKKPLVVGPADDVKALDAVARKIVKLLDDNGMWTTTYIDGDGVMTTVIYKPRPTDPGDGFTKLVDTVLVTVTEDPTVVYQR